MARIDLIVDLEGSSQRTLSALKPGEQLCNVFMPPIEVLGETSPGHDISIEVAEASFYYARLGALLDDNLPRGHWVVDWRDRSAPKPTLRLSHDLFAHVTEALERA